jgi:hypothetical protein
LMSREISRRAGEVNIIQSAQVVSQQRRLLELLRGRGNGFRHLGELLKPSTCYFNRLCLDSLSHKSINKQSCARARSLSTTPKRYPLPSGFVVHALQSTIGESLRFRSSRFDRCRVFSGRTRGSGVADPCFYEVESGVPTNS